ncbi:TetR/AcrR family transcriptional regulator [Sphingobacterium oryzagri]|uniref:TetR/AcrR family transcriptional regulator n=1 Tax=Sphingobacterium oryzagri TaxID=3025669 RepID=A0ABY7WF16_9SPHI|nr:TetR/AcrR family transcriptional regulator [Sphingobacterium sp. KACC 22765]WDF66973.1 TetR/AcrR family transcriptional regulator [Sphingobacterium sp. KACC 22765]
MSKAEQTRQFIIEKSAPIFNVKGYDNTSLSDIQKATKLTKGAIYGNFSDKNELAIAAYEHSSSVVFEAISNRVKNTASAKEALLAYPNYYVQNWQLVFQKGGCPLMNAAVEADDHLHFMRDIVRKSIMRFIQSLQDVIEQGQAKKEFYAKISAAEYAAMIFSLMEGTIMLAKLMNDTKYFQIVADRIKNIVEQELMR